MLDRLEGDVIRIIRTGWNVFLRHSRISVLPAQEFELPRPDLHKAVVGAFIILLLAVLQLPPDANLGTLGAVLADDDLRQALEGRHPEPVDLLYLLSVLTGVDFIDGKGETGYRYPVWVDRTSGS